MNQNFEQKILIIFLISIFVGVGFVFYLQNKAYAATCGNGVCESGEGENCSNCSIDCGSCPSVDLKVNGSDGPVNACYQDSILLSWTSQNATSCQASGDWSGSKSTSSTETIQLNSVKTYTFIITCTSSYSQNASDSVEVKVSPTPPKVVTKPIINTR